MSRVRLTSKNPKEHPEVIVGLDKTFGWFFQVFGPTQNGEDVLVIDEDEVVTPHFDHIRVIALIKQYAEMDLHSLHAISMIKLELDPAIQNS